MRFDQIDWYPWIIIKFLLSHFFFIQKHLNFKKYKRPCLKVTIGVNRFDVSQPRFSLEVDRMISYNQEFTTKNKTNKLDKSQPVYKNCDDKFNVSSVNSQSLWSFRSFRYMSATKTILHDITLHSIDKCKFDYVGSFKDI